MEAAAYDIVFFTYVRMDHQNPYCYFETMLYSYYSYIAILTVSKNIYPYISTESQIP